MPLPPWKLNLQPASYKGVGFHVDVDTRSGGRRLVTHEFPKKDVPYTEDMGRRARRFSISGYVIGPTYQPQRDALVQAFEDEGQGALQHPTYQFPYPVVVDSYTVTERRERGGWAEFEAVFIEAGQGVDAQTLQDSQKGVTNSAQSAVPTASSNFGNDFSGSSDITALQATA